MSDIDEESALDEKPSEFFSGIASTGGYHDGQAIVPEGDHYRCWCSCGEWQAEAPTEAEGLHLARVHTGSEPAPLGDSEGYAPVIRRGVSAAEAMLGQAGL